jgi:hypothetical protein
MDLSLAVIIYSHSHMPPLVPRPDLKYNLRGLTNPPKAIRDRYDGRSKRLREHFRYQDDFKEALRQAHGEIEAAGNDVLQQWPQDQHATKVHDAKAGLLCGQSVDLNVPSEDSIMRDDVRDGYGAEGDVEQLGGIEQVQSGPTLRVGCFCERGRHRSVAFAEELATLSWPEHFTIKIEHRDVDDHVRRDTLKQRRKKSNNMAQLDYLHEDEGYE